MNMIKKILPLLIAAVIGAALMYYWRIVYINWIDSQYSSPLMKIGAVYFVAKGGSKSEFDRRMNKNNELDKRQREIDEEIANMRRREKANQ